MSYGTCESAGEKAIGLDQDKRKNRGEGRVKQTNPKAKRVKTPPPPPTPTKGLRRAHESNPSALAAKLDKFAYTRVYLYRESHSRGRNAHTLLKQISRCQFVRIKASVTRASTGNSNLFPVDARITKAWDSRDELRDVRVLGSQAKDSLDERKVSTGLPNPITRN